MKRLLLIALLSLFLTNCEKETVECNCGLILDDDVTNYSVLIENDCSGNKKWFTLYPGDWMKAYVGSHYCIENVQSW